MTMYDHDYGTGVGIYDLPGLGTRRRRRRKSVYLPLRFPNLRQWKKINKRLHEYGVVARSITRRLYGEKSRRRRPYAQARRRGRR